MIERSTWYKRGAKYHVLRYDPDFALKQTQEEEDLAKPSEELNKLLKATEGCDFTLQDVVQPLGNTKKYRFRRRTYSMYNLNERLNLYYAICCAYHLKPIKIMTVKEYADYLKERKGLK